MKVGSVKSVYVASLFTVAMVFIPWEYLQGYDFQDLSVYVRLVREAELYGFRFGKEVTGYIDYVTYEYLWFYISLLIESSKIEPELVFTFFTAFCSFVYMLYLYRKTRFYWIGLLLFSPIVIVLLSSQIRSAFAFSFVLLATLLTDKKKYIVAVFLVVSFIHTSMLALLGIAVIAYFIVNKTKLYSIEKVLVAALVGLTGGLVLGLVVPEILAGIGDRRGYRTYVTESFWYISFWFAWVGLMVLGVDRKKEPTIEYLFSVIICLTATIATLFGFYSFRFVALAMPLIISCIPQMRTEFRLIAYLAFSLDVLLLYYYYLFV
jgi:hypothetical protein